MVRGRLKIFEKRKSDSLKDNFPNANTIMSKKRQSVINRTSKRTSRSLHRIQQMPARRRASVDVLPSRNYPLFPTDDEVGHYDIYYEHSNSSYTSHKNSARPIETIIHALLKDSRALDDVEGVFPMLDRIFSYVASNTKFFNQTTFSNNLTTLISRLTNLHVQQVNLWKRDMFLAIQGEKANVSTIRKLIRVNGFDLDSEIGPIPREDRGSKRSPKFHTALTWASYQGNLNLVKCLIAEGANPNALTSQGLAAIHCCSMGNDSDHLAVLKYLLEHPRLKINVDFCNEKDGTTSLMLACSFGAYKIAEYLLKHDAVVNQQDKEGKSALFYAAKGRHLDLMKLLISHNACVYLRDDNNATVLHHLLHVSRSSSYMLIRNVIDILTFLVDEKGLSVLNSTIDGSTPLHEACRSGLTDVVDYLLGNGAKLEAKKNGWETPLWTSVMGKPPRCRLITLLLEKGANFEAKHCLGMTLLQYAQKVSKNARLVAALEDGQRCLRAKRMKALIAKRKEILSFSSTMKCLKYATARDTSCTLGAVKRERLGSFESNKHLYDYLFNSEEEESTLGSSGRNIRDHSEDGNHSSPRKSSLGRSEQSTVYVKPMILDKKPIKFERDYDGCSTISSGSLPSVKSAKKVKKEEPERDEKNKIEEDDDYDYISDDEGESISGGVDNADGIADAGNKKSKVPIDNDEESSSSSSSDDDDSTSSISSSSFSDDDDENNNDINYIPPHTAPIDQDMVDISDAELDDEEDEQQPLRGQPINLPPPPAAAVATASSSSNTNSNNFKADDCFERLLRKKRQLEEETKQTIQRVGAMRGEPSKSVAARPQKIQCVRRDTFDIISSDSD